jgi:hypothetical protein
MKKVLHETFVSRKSKPKLFRSLVAGCGLLLLLPSAWAQFPSLPVYESFGQYAEGEQLGTNGDSGIYWDVGNGGSNGVTSYIITSAAAMSFPALLGDTNSTPKGVMSVYENTTSADRGFMFPTNTGTIYGSFLLNYLDNGAATANPTNRCIFNIVTGATDATNGSFGSVFSSVWLTGDYRILINKNFNGGGTNTSPSAVLATNVAHFIVVRYLVHAGGNDEWDLWIDPMPFGNDSRIPPPTLSTTNGPNITNFNAVMLNFRKNFFGYYDATAFYEDEIRVGSDWATVTPLASPPPGPYFAVTGGGTTCPGSPPSVALNGSVATNVYLLYANNTYTGVSLPGTGSALNFGTQSTPAVYSVLASNTATANIGWMSNSVTVAVIPPPNIVTEPSPVITATNNRAEFIVGVTGGGLGYQWYSNGIPLTDGTNITGSQTKDLVIWPATPANIGSYYCVITNSCGLSSTTTTNSLTLDAPNTLVWTGDGFNLLVWAVGTTAVAEFRDTNSNPAFFNEGDNVTFDDTYNVNFGTNITLTGVLTPASLTYDTSYGLAWAGTGSIAGTTSLLVDGSGVLTLKNNSSGSFANPFTGGTVISNGTVNMPSSWTGLGTGPVTLAGGTLETAQKSSGVGSTVGLLQNLYVTANSTWQIDKTGNQCAGLAGALLGNPGTTLMISNSINDNHPEEMRFNGVFTNFCAIVTAINPLTTNQQMQIGSFNSTGAQIYNGAISGATAAFFVSGAGAVYLNGTNTYPLGTTNTAGFLAGSGSIAGPLAVSSGATLGAGSPNAIGTFTVNNSITLSNANVFIRVDKSLAQSNDLLSATGLITNAGSGTVTVTNLNLAMPLVAGDKYQIFSGAVKNGATLAVTGGGVGWTNNLAVDGSIQAVNVIAAYPTNISYSISGSTQTLSWPATHLGWILQSQTNSLSTGLGTNWHDIPVSAAFTTVGFPNHTNAVVFYRLRHP